MIHDDLLYVECEACGGEGVPLGTLADLEWFRCRACGLFASLRVARGRGQVAATREFATPTAGRPRGRLLSGGGIRP